MKIDKLARLFQAVGTSQQNQRTERTAEPQANSVDSSKSSAVSVAPSLGESADQVARRDREEKVARIKAEVNSGTYQKDSRVVAEAIVRELLI